MDVFGNTKAWGAFRNLVVIVLLCLLCGSLFAVISDGSDAAVGDEFVVGDITYVITNEGIVNEVHIYGADGSISEYVGTDTVTYDGVVYRITSIRDYAFHECDLLKSVIIPDSVTSIGESAFGYCISLTSVTIGNGVTSIGYDAFEHCISLTSVTIPDSVTSICIGAFHECISLTSVTIGSSVTSIGEFAFLGCYSLVEVCDKSILRIHKGLDDNGLVAYYAENVYSPWSGESILFTHGDYIFMRCDGSYYLVKYIGDGGDITLPSRLTDGKDTVLSYGIHRYALYDMGNITGIVIPDSVTSIGDYTFFGCDSLTSVTIGKGVTSIGDYAFQDCSSLTSVTIPDNVTSLGNGTFSRCSSLASVTIGKGVTSIGSRAFECCGLLTSVTIPDNVTSIGDHAFFFCGRLSSVTIGKGVTSIGYNAFQECGSLTSVTIPDSVTFIGNGTFSRCSSLASVTIGNCDVSIDDYAFYMCNSLTSVTIGNGDISIGKYAFEYCRSLTSVILGNGVTSIGDSAFKDCRSLTSMTLPDSVTHIGDHAFQNCSSLTSVTLGNSLTSIGSEVFDYCESLTSVIIPDSVTSIGDSAFFMCGRLSSVTIGNGVTSIGDSAFSNCGSLTSVTIPESVTSIEGGAFYGCHSLVEVCNKSTLDITKGSHSYGYVAYYAENVYVPGSGESILFAHGDFIFMKCDGSYYLVKYIGDGGDITFPSRLTDGKDTVLSYGIYQYALYGISSVTGIVMPDSVTSIGENVFIGCSSLEWFKVSENNKAYSSDSFGALFDKGKTVLIQYPIGNGRASYVIPDGVTSIGDSAFEHCRSLTSVTIPDSVTSIGDLVFYECDSLERISFGKSLTTIGFRAFDIYTFYDSDGVTQLHCSAENLKGCVFAGNNGKMVKQITHTVNSYTILFDSNGVPMEGYPIEMCYGSEIPLPTLTPALDPVGDVSYVFRGWNGFHEGIRVSGDMTFEAMFEATITGYTEDDDGDLVIDAGSEFSIQLDTNILDDMRGDIAIGSVAVIHMAEGHIVFDTESLSRLKGGEILTVHRVDKVDLDEQVSSVVGDRPIYGISVGDVHDFGGGVLTIRLHYVLGEGESDDHLEIWHFRSDGSCQKVPCTYDATGRYVEFTTGDLSHFAVMHVVPDNDGGDSVGGMDIHLIAGAIVAVIVFVGVQAFLHIRGRL